MFRNQPLIVNNLSAYAVISFSFLSNANITNALTRQSAMRIPQLYISGILFHNIDGIELR